MMTTRTQLYRIYRYRLSRLKNDCNGVIGLPIRLLIMIIIAGVALVAILSFIIVSSPHLGRIEIKPILINGNPEDNIICDNKSADGTHYYRGVDRTIDGVFFPKEAGYSEYIDIYVYDDRGNPLPDVNVYADGCGVRDAGRTDGNGYVKIKLTGCKLPPGVFVGTIKIVASHSATIGEEVRKTSIAVIAPVG